ncbi:hypothetical protein DFP72DRAFT_933537 [Ephemerocybe angulata]|uniref:Uncharacterized protein n=1 Tax=Ephemerocybe angulata TaxID=980116 RepID=A0A8H6LWL9_9AGAR|nr:hypothetical protein DFP72DRAFT_933537 [Tulosesus angulatus]
MPMATKPVSTSKPTSSRSVGEEISSSSSSRENREVKLERQSTRKAPAEDAQSAGSARESQSSAPTKDFNKGDLRSGALNEGMERRTDETLEDKAKGKNDKEKDLLPASRELGDRTTSTARSRSASPIKRKGLPAEQPQTQEPPRSLIVALDDVGMGSPVSSVEDMDSDYEESRKMVASAPFPPPPPPPLPFPKEELVEINQALAQAKQAEAQIEEDKIKRDHALAKQLQLEEINVAPHGDRSDRGAIPGGFPDTGDARASTRSSSTRSFWTASPEAQLEKYREKYASMKRRCEELEDFGQRAQQQVQEYHSAYSRSYHQLRAVEMEFNSARKHIHHLDGELKTARHELGAVKQQLSDAVNLSEVRGKELKGAQVFLTKADTLSVTDVVQKVNALNEEIFQMAAFLGEVLIYEVLEEGVDRHSVRQQAVTSGYSQAERLLGEKLANVLAQESIKEPKEPSNPLLVQIVMQIAFTQWCARLGSRWTSYHKVDKAKHEEGEEGAGEQEKERSGNASVQNQREHDNLISELYDSIRDHEDQAVAGRWRSLTRAHLPYSTSGWDHNLMLGIVSILGIAGWSTRTQDDLVQIENRLSSIFKPLLELRKATGEDVTSADLEISVVRPGTQFDPTYMEDAYADGRSSSKSKKSAPEEVISTSGLGLKRIVVKRLKTGGIQRQAEALSMPKVVLEKTIKEALEPPPPTRKKKKATEGGGGGSLGGLLGF